MITFDIEYKKEIVSCCTDMSKVMRISTRYKRFYHNRVNFDFDITDRSIPIESNDIITLPHLVEGQELNEKQENDYKYQRALEFDLLIHLKKRLILNIETQIECIEDNEQLKKDMLPIEINFIPESDI